MRRTALLTTTLTLSLAACSAGDTEVAEADKAVTDGAETGDVSSSLEGSSSIAEEMGEDADLATDATTDPASDVDARPQVIADEDIDPREGRVADGDRRPDTGERTVATIPVGFRGNWAPSREACAPPAMERIAISGEEIGYFEESVSVDSVRVDGNYAAASVSGTTLEGLPTSYVFYMALEDAGHIWIKSGDLPRRALIRCR